MIRRYSTQEMTGIWSESNKFKLWALVEITVLRVRALLGHFTAPIPTDLPDRLKIDPEEIDAIEKAGLGHDVMAFLRHISPQLPEGLRQWLHQKLTSYDVVDPALMLCLQKSVDMLRDELRKLMEALKARAFEHKHTPMIGRTHLVHAEPITFGVKLANWYAELKRHSRRLENLRETVSVGKLSGAVGMYELPPEVEEQVCTRLSLKPVIATQIIARDIIAEYMTTLALVGNSLEKFCVDIRLLQSTEVREVQEYFDSKKQHGSSAMPHKRNPIGCENICSLARQLRSSVLPAMENQVTWQERSLDNSGNERVFLPDASQLLHFMLRRFTSIISKLQVFPERMKQNLELTRGLIYSQDVQSAVAEHSGLPREEAYDLVFHIAQQCWEDGSGFKEALLADLVITAHVNPVFIERAFSLEDKLRHVDHIFKRVFGNHD